MNQFGRYFVVAITQVAFVFSVLAYPVLATEQDLEKARFAQLAAQIEEELKSLPPAKLRDLQRKYIQSINQSLKKLENFVGRPEAFRAHLLTQLDATRNHLTQNYPSAPGNERDLSLRKFEELRTRILSSQVDPDQAYRNLYELREKLQSLGAKKVFKCIAAFFATIYICLGVVLGSVIVVVGVLVAVLSFGLFIESAHEIVHMGGLLVVRCISGMEDVWDWALE